MLMLDKVNSEARFQNPNDTRNEYFRYETVCVIKNCHNRFGSSSDVSKCVTLNNRPAVTAHDSAGNITTVITTLLSAHPNLEATHTKRLSAPTKRITKRLAAPRISLSHMIMHHFTYRWSVTQTTQFNDVNYFATLPASATVRLPSVS
jgi:hypothetical protein